MSASMVNLILWLPFGIVCLVSGVLFLIAGFRRGLLNALVSTGGTIAAAAISLGLGKLIAVPIAPIAAKLLPAMDTSGLGAALEGLAQGAVAMVIAMVLFMVLMLSLTPTCKKILKRFVRFPAGTKNMKWAGLLVRAVDAVLFASLLLSPVYGTLYNYLPVADALMQMQPEQDSEVTTVLSAAQKHPTVKLAGFGPADWVYRGLSQLNTDEVSVNAVTVTDTVKDLSALMAEMKVNENTNSLDATKKILAYARDNLLEKKWASQLIVNVGKDYLQQQIASTGGENSMLSQVLADVQITPEQFQKDGKDLLDVVIGVMDLQSEGATEQDAQALTEKIGTLLSENETVQQLRTQLYVKAATSVLQDDSAETVQKITERLESVELTREQQIDEAQIFLQLMAGSDKESALAELSGLGLFDKSISEKLPLFGTSDKMP